MIRAGGVPERAISNDAEGTAGTRAGVVGVIGAAESVIDWTERQSKAIILGLGMLLGVAATMIVATIYASLPARPLA